MAEDSDGGQGTSRVAGPMIMGNCDKRIYLLLHVVFGKCEIVGGRVCGHTRMRHLKAELRGARWTHVQRAADTYIHAMGKFRDLDNSVRARNPLFGYVSV